MKLQIYKTDLISLPSYGYNSYSKSEHIHDTLKPTQHFDNFTYFAEGTSKLYSNHAVQNCYLLNNQA
jgi:hypothetical protein